MIRDSGRYWLAVSLPALLALGTTSSGCARDVEHDGKPIEYWVEQMTSADSAVRNRAVAAFAHDVDRSPTAARALIGVLGTERSADVHATIAEALGLLGPSALEAVPTLVRLLEGDAHEIVRTRVATALGGVGTASPLVVPALIRSLDDPAHDVRAAGAEALGRIGPAAGASVPGLARLATTDRMGFVRYQATRALGQVHARPEVGVPALMTVLRSESPMDREQALDALARYGPAAAPATAPIRAALRDSLADVRESATRALSSVSGARP